MEDNNIKSEQEKQILDDDALDAVTGGTGSDYIVGRTMGQVKQSLYDLPSTFNSPVATVAPGTILVGCTPAFVSGWMTVPVKPNSKSIMITKSDWFSKVTSINMFIEANHVDNQGRVL